MNHSSSWVHNTVYIYNESKKIENARITNASENEYLYPFVKNGDQYRIYIVHMDENWGNWGSTDNENGCVRVEAIGGLGNFNTKYRKYIWNNSSRSLTLKQYTVTRPNLATEFKYNATIFTGKAWTSGVLNKSINDVSNNRNNFSFMEANGFFGNSEKISVEMSYEFNYNGVSYSCPVISDMVYQYSEFNTQVKLSPNKSIPKVYITSSNGWSDGTTYHFNSEWVSASIKIIGASNSEYNLSNTNIYIKDRGNSTKWTAKVPYSLKFETKTKVLGMSKSKRWVLMANYFDPSLIRTRFAGYLGRNVFDSYWNAKFKPVNVYINDVFVGTYDLGECNKVEKNRVNVQSVEDYYKNDPEYVDVNNDGKIDIEDGGFMVEIDTAINWGNKITEENYKTDVATDNNGAERIYFYSAEKCIPMTLKDPDFGDSSKYTKEQCKEAGLYAKSKIDAFEKMLYSSDFSKNYKNYIEETSFIDWFFVNEFSKNSDANFQKSVPVVYNPETKKLSMGPNWDFDLSLGNFGHSFISKDGGSDTVDNPKGWYIWGGKKGCDENGLFVSQNGAYVQTFWINRLMESSEFKKAAKNRWIEKKLDLKTAIENKIIEYANDVAYQISENEKILPRLGQYEWNAPSGYINRVDYEDEISYLYNWCMSRYTWMDSQISSW